MKRQLLSIAVLFLLIVAVIFAAGCVGAKDINTLVVGIDVYEPYSWTNENGEIVGFDIDCMKWIAAAEGFNVTFEYINWDALPMYLETGKRDIICSGLGITKERQKIVDFSDPYWKIKMDVVSLAGKNYTMDQFYAGDLKIGVQAGSSAAEGLESYLGTDLYMNMLLSGRIVNTYTTFAFAMEDLKNGRLNVVVYDDAGVKSQMDEHPGMYEVVGEIQNAHEVFAAAVKKGNTELLKKINDGYAKLKASPDWEKLIKKYNLT